MACIIGIDPSINSTGICVNNNGIYTYYIITSKMTKKMKNFRHNNIFYIPYEKETYTDKEYADKEIIKTNNFYNVINLIETILKKYKPDIVIMEGISYGSVSGSSLADLAGLNYLIRMLLKIYNIKFIIVSPSSLKKFVCANGQAEKDVIVASWKKMDKNIIDVEEIKIDDLADAFFLSNYTQNK